MAGAFVATDGVLNLQNLGFSEKRTGLLPDSLSDASAEPARPPIRRARPVKPCGKHSPVVRKKMLPFVLVAWPTVRGYRPKVFMHCEIGFLLFRFYMVRGLLDCPDGIVFKCI